MTKKTKNIVAVAILLVLVIGAALIMHFASPKAVEGAKTVTITVIDNNGEKKVYEVHTDAMYLRGAMEEAKGLEFSGSEYDGSMVVETINGLTPDYAADGAYWAFYQDLNADGETTVDEYCMYGIDTQPVNDGEAYIIVYEVYTAA